jgi:hypothetical protein
MSTRVEGATALVMVKAHATLSAGPVHLVPFAGEGPAPGTWRYNLSDPDDRRIVYGRVAGKATHLEVLRYAAGRCVDAYAPGTRSGTGCCPCSGSSGAFICLHNR